jgi:CBS domain-containing protein
MKSLTAKDIMTQEVLAARADWSLDRLAEFFADNNISGAPVIDKNETLIGVVSLTDMARHESFSSAGIGKGDVHEFYYQELDSQYEREELATLRIRTESVTTVCDIMTPMLFAVDEETVVREVADTMVRGHIHRVLVTRDKKVTGIVTALDMLKIVRDFR